MANSGEHRITSGGHRPPPPPEEHHPIATFFGIAFLLYWFVSCVAGLSQPDTKRPIEPTPPHSRAAIIESADTNSSKIVASIEVVLGGGSCAISYEPAENLASVLAALSASKTGVFVANFKTGEKSGSPNKADTIVLVGTLKLTVAAISDDDSFRGGIVNRAKQMNAYFDYSNSARGPPTVGLEKRRIRVIIVGEFAAVDLPSSYGQSTSDIQILDLDPTEHEEAEYVYARMKYEQEVKEYDHPHYDHPEFRGR